MRANFEDFLKLILLTEGGYTVDKGGPTMKGVTLTTAREFIDPNMTIDALKLITDAQVGAVYYAEYWVKAGCDLIPSGLDYCSGDYAVNSGPVRPVHELQTLLGVAVDGLVGPKTLAALAQHDPNALIDAMCDQRLGFMRGLSNWPEAGAGWTKRVASVRAHSHAMATATPLSPAVTASLAYPDVAAAGKAVAPAPIGPGGVAPISPVPQLVPATVPVPPTGTAPRPVSEVSPAAQLGQNLMNIFSSLASVATLAQAAVHVAGSLGTAAPALATGAQSVITSGKAVVSDLEKVIDDLKTGKYADTPADIERAVTDVGTCIAAIEAEVAQVAALASASTTLPSVSGIGAIIAALA